jgi:electron transfer flavoprotein alpha subunit
MKSSGNAMRTEPGIVKKYQDIWILAEQRNERLQRVSFELVTRGLALAHERECRLCAMIFGAALPDHKLQKLIDAGVDRVVAMEASELTNFLVEPYAKCMAWLIDEYRPETILAGATSLGRTLMPYVAMTANCGLTADCTELAIDPETGNLLQTRPAIGGNIMATIHTPEHRPQMATVRPHSTAPAAPIPGRQSSRVEIIRHRPVNDLLGSRVTHLGFTPNEEDRGLKDAEVVVCVGRGIKKPENIPLARNLANALGGVLGATRDVVDRGWLSYPHQIGLSGQTITPELYIGIGVSGAIQHLAGMQTAKTIVAINRDPDAQILKVADFAIVGDLFEVVPALLEQLEKNAAHR